MYFWDCDYVRIDLSSQASPAKEAMVIEEAE